MIKDLRKSDPRQWYSKLKRMCSSDPSLENHIIVDEIMHLTDQEQADAIAKRMALISQEFDALRECDIKVPPFEQSTIPQFSRLDVKNKLLGIKTISRSLLETFHQRLLSSLQNKYLHP